LDIKGTRGRRNERNQGGHAEKVRKYDERRKSVW